MGTLEMKAWYFSNTDKKLRFGDNRKIELGATHTIEGSPILCTHGLHASLDILDALRYAPGPVIWRVELSGEIIKGKNKIVSTERKYIGGGIDISAVLHKFARMCALDVVHLWDAPEVVIKYLKTGDESLRAAAAYAAAAAAAAAHAAHAAHAAYSAAAYSAAAYTAHAAAHAAATAAAYTAAAYTAHAAHAAHAAYSAAAYAAHAAAHAAATAAAYTARSACSAASIVDAKTRKKQGRRLYRMVTEAIK